MKKDTIFNNPEDPLHSFAFDRKVADVFPDMIGRSVPGYNTIIDIIGIISAVYAQPSTNCYDLGSSLGAVSLAMRKNIKVTDVHIIAVDNSSAMIEKSRRLLGKVKGIKDIRLVCDDILNVHVENASVVVSNFTFQFLDLKNRKRMTEKIFRGLNPGGIFILSEKIKFPSREVQNKQTEWHHSFKKANGYSDLEIARKRTALENVLIPETIRQHKNRMKKAGFRETIIWYQCFNFASIIAIK